MSPPESRRRRTEHLAQTSRRGQSSGLHHNHGNRRHLFVSAESRGAQALDALVAQHVPTLKGLDLVTDRPAVHATAADGTRVKVFEWKSEDASRSAHSQPEVAALWEAMSKVADFVPLNSLPETSRPFAHFTPSG